MPYVFWALFMGLALHADVKSAGVGFVKGSAVTSRQVQIHHFIETALYGRQDPKTLQALALDSKNFAKVVSETLIEMAVAMEAESFNVVQVEAAELEKSERRVQSAFKDNRAWRELDVQPAELKRAVKQKVQAKRFVQFRARSSVLPITDMEAQKYFTDNRLKFGDLPFENFKENIKAYLGRTQVERRLKDWYDVLINKYQVKNLIAEM